MGIPLSVVHLLSENLPLLGDLGGKKVLTIGVQDCHFDYDRLKRFVQRHGLPWKKLDPKEIRLTDGFRWLPPAQRERYRMCVHQETLFRLIGFAPENIHALDHDPYEGADIIHDLNEPVDTALYSSFDLILDSGTLEHVFSLKDAFANLCRMCKVGGLVVMVNPVDYVNHGMVNFNAELLRDCFLANGFEEHTIKYVATPTNPFRGGRYYREYAPERLGCLLRPFYSMLVYGAYKKVEDRPFVVPQQGYYRRLWTAGSSAMPSRNRLADWLPQFIKNWLCSSLLYTYIVIRRGKKVFF